MTDAPRVIHVVTTDMPAGRRDTLSALLAARGSIEHQVRHVGAGPAPVGDRRARRVASWLNLPWTAAAAMRREVRAGPPTVLHAWTLRAAAACAALAAEDVPLIIQADGDDDASATARWYTSREDRTPVHFIVSAAVPQRELARHGVPSRACALIRDSVDFAALNAARSTDVRSELRLDRDDRALLLLPPMARHAGHFHAAWAALLAQVVRGDVRLIVPGGAESGRIERLVRETGFGAMLRTTGDAFALPQLLGAADLVLFLPPGRASVAALAWAMAAGKPILASAVWTVTELLADGHNGWLVRASDPRAAARRVVDALDRPDALRDLTALARAQAYEVFGRQRMVSQFLRAYGNLAARRAIGDGITDSAQRP